MVQGGAAGGNPTPPPKGTGLIVGQVVDGSTGRPVGGAIVTMTGSATPAVAPSGATPSAPSTPSTPPPASAGRSGAPAAVPPGGPGGPMGPGGPGGPGGNQQVPAQRVMTDGDGRFMFHDLPKGTFTLNATASGYTNGGYGQRKPNGPSRSLDLDAGQRLPDATLRIWRFGAITGTVVDEFGDPLVNVSVRVLRRTLVSGQRRLVPAYSAQTDDRGIYRSASLPPGDYIVAIPTGTASVPTSLVEQYQQMLSVVNQGSDASPQAISALQAAQQQIDAFRQNLANSGAPVPSTNGYRVGNSQIQPSTVLSRVTPPPADASRVFVYQTTFFPATPSSAQAQVITIASGEERSGVDLQMHLVGTSRVSGTLLGPDGPAVNMGLRLVPADARDLASENGYETATTVTDAAGQFTFLGVPPGQYLVRAQKFPRPQDQFAPMAVPVGGRMMVSPPVPSGPAPIVEPTLWAEIPVTVADADVTNLAAAFRNGVRVSGRIEFEGEAVRPTPDRMQQITVSINPSDGRNAGPLQPTRVRPDGQFTSMQYLPGKYLISAGSPGSGWVLKSVMANGRDATWMPLTLESSDIGGIVVTYTDKQTQLSGSVQGAGGAPEPQGLVVIFPMNYQQWMDNGMPSRVMRTARTTKTGTYQVSSLPIGDYLVAAISDELQGDWQDPQTIPSVARIAARLTIAEGEKKTLDLRVSQIR
jgi:hypothetical protein